MSGPDEPRRTGAGADPEAGVPPVRPISPGLAALAPLTLLGAFVTAALTIGLDTEVLILAMLLAAAVGGVVAVSRGATWSEIEAETGRKIAAVLPVVLILLSIGALIGTWVLSGTIPTLVALGVELIRPDVFVLTSFLVTCVMSICTGTSWGSAGTLGVALMGAATAVGAPLEATAGAVVSGAYFGDKLSPLSDTTNICALAARTRLYDHIRHLLYTSVPSFLLACLVFGLAAAPGSGAPGRTAQARSLLLDIDTHFRAGLWAWAPLALVILGIVARRPPALVLAASSLVAMVIGATVQGFAPRDALMSAVAGFDPAMLDDRDGFADPAGAGELFLSLVERGGLYSMANTLVVILAAFLLASTMEVSGALRRLLDVLLAGVRSVFGLIASTMAAGATLVSLTSHSGVSALIVGELFAPAYRARGLAARNLSRTLEDSITMVEVLLPWTVSAIFFATTLGVDTLSYAPWAVFNWCSPLMSLVLAAGARRWGFGIRRLSADVD